MTPELTAIFDQAVLDVETIAQEQPNDDSQVIPVNMYDGFQDRYLSDDIHYSEEGAKFIAERYHEVTNRPSIAQIKSLASLISIKKLHWQWRGYYRISPFE